MGAPADGLPSGREIYLPECEVADYRKPYRNYTAIGNLMDVMLGKWYLASDETLDH